MTISPTSDGSLQVKETLFELIPTQELNLDTLKDAKDAKPSQDEIDEELDERRVELESIGVFMAAKKERLAKELRDNPNAAQKVVETPKKKKQNTFGTGRPRKSFVKEVTFKQLDNGKFALAGRGRPSPDQQRKKVVIHYSSLSSLSPKNAYSHKDIENMKQPCRVQKCE
jgi:hypothetical protein